YCAEIETGGRLEPGELLIRNTALGERGLQRLCLLSAADERDVIGIDRKRRKQGSFVAATLRRDDNIASPRFVDRKSIALNAPIVAAKGGLRSCRRSAPEAKPRAFGQIEHRSGHRPRSGP